MYYYRKSGGQQLYTGEAEEPGGGSDLYDLTPPI